MNRNARTGKVFLLESSITLKLLFPITDKKKILVRSGIRTHAWRTRLRPERSALDRSAILTSCRHNVF